MLAKIAIQLSDSPQLVSDTEEEPKRLRNNRKRAEPKKRKQPTPRNRSLYDIIPSNHNRPTNNHDYDTIVLDCDDIFKGGPSVQITRNVDGANSCITDDNTELQVNVRVNGELNKYTMRRVC